MTGGPGLKWAELNPVLVSVPCPLSTDPSETSEKQQWTPGSGLEELNLFPLSAASSFQCIFHRSYTSWGFPGGTRKDPACQHKRLGFDPWVGKIPRRRAWQPIPCSCLENPMDRGAWRATVSGVAKSWTWLSDFVIHHMSLQWQFPWPLIVLPSDLPGEKKSTTLGQPDLPISPCLHLDCWALQGQSQACPDRCHWNSWPSTLGSPIPGSIRPSFIAVISNSLHWLLICCFSCGSILHHVWSVPWLSDLHRWHHLAACPLASCWVWSRRHWQKNWRAWGQRDWVFYFPASSLPHHGPGKGWVPLITVSVG